VTDFRRLIELLADAGVEFIVVGGVAAAAHGAVRATLDLDIVYRRTPDNLRRLATSLSALHPYPRGAPPGLPFLWDERTLQNGLNFTLATEIGSLDLLGEITAGGGYDELKDRSMEIQVFGRRCRCINLDELIRVKRAAGRPKDYEAIAELEKLLELTQSTDDR
jgi:predicted nucleotidyltransferase